jgi:hypothetical protein
MLRNVQDGQWVTDRQSALATSFSFQKKIRKIPHSERDSPEVEEGSTTETSSVSIALIVEMNQRKK